MSVIIQLIINGLIAGSIYALMASSFSLVFSIIKFMDFSLGSIFVAGAFSAYAFNVLLGLDFFVSIIFSLVIIALAGLIVNKFVYRQLRERKSDNFVLLLASFGVFLIINGIVLLAFGAEVRTFKLNINEVYGFGGAVITKIQIILILASLFFLLLLHLFMKYTRIGKSMRAVADNKEISATLGIKVEKTIAFAFVSSYVISGIAGILLALEQNLEQSVGLSVIIKSITASIVGGIGNTSAALVGGFFVGIVENFGTFFLPSSYKDAITFGILIIFLIFRPNGIFGLTAREA